MFFDVNDPYNTSNERILLLRWVLLPALRIVQVEQSQMAITRKKAAAIVKRIPVMTWDATKALALFLWEAMKNPRVLKDKLGEAQYLLKEVCVCWCSCSGSL